MTNLEKRTIVLNSIFNFGSSLVSNFVSIYLFIYTESIPMMCLYIICRISMFPVFSIIGSKLLKKHALPLTYTLGLVLITVALIYALTCGFLFEKNPYYVLLAAFAMGAGEGLYWLSANSCNQIVTEIKTRSRFFAFNGVFSNITSLLAPMYATLMLSISSNELAGYKKILLTIIIIFVFVICIALSMNVKSEDKDSHIIKAMKLDDKMWRDHSLAVLCYGLRDGLGLNTIGLLVYNAAGNSGTYSKLNIVFSIITVIVYRASTRFMDRTKISKTFKIGAALKILGTYALVFVPNIAGAIFYGVTNALAAVLYDNSFSYISANIVGQYPLEMTARVGARETYLSISRCVSMLIVLMFYKLLPENLYIQVSVVILALSTIPVERILLKYK